MNPSTRRRTLTLTLVAITASALILLWPSNAQPSQQDIQAMKTFTDNMTTHCVGRFLIAAPKGDIDAEGNYGFQIASIKPLQKTQLPVQNRLGQLDEELTRRVVAQSTWKSLYKKPLQPAVRSAPQPNIRSIWFGEPDTGDSDSTMMEGYVVQSAATFVFTTSAIAPARVEAFNSFLVEVAPALSIRDNATIPTSPGFCFDNGFIAMKPAKGESADWSWDLPGHADVRFNLSLHTNSKTIPQGILDRESTILKNFELLVGKDETSRIKTLRKRRFDLNGMAAQEWLKELRGSSTEYEYTLDIPGKPNDLANPSLSLSLRVGDLNKKGDVKPSLTPGEAIALWDAVIQTLRLRPGAI